MLTHDFLGFYKRQLKLPDISFLCGGDTCSFLSVSFALIRCSMMHLFFFQCNGGTSCVRRLLNIVKLINLTGRACRTLGRACQELAEVEGR